MSRRRVVTPPRDEPRCQDQRRHNLAPLVQGDPGAFRQGELVGLRGPQVLLDPASKLLPAPERRLAALALRLLEIGREPEGMTAAGWA